LAQKDRDLSEFMNSYHETREKSRNEIQRYEENILELLENLSKNINILKQKPTQEQVMEMVDEGNFVEGQKKNAETTLARLKSELQLRMEDKKRLEDAEKTVPNVRIQSWFIDSVFLGV
jgi:site-specific recombinase XerD